MNLLFSIHFIVLTDLYTSRYSTVIHMFFMVNTLMILSQNFDL